VGLADALAGKALVPETPLVVAVADGGYASLKLLDRCRRLKKPITFITRLRLDAALYEPAAPRKPGQIGRPRLKGSRLPNLSVVADDPKTAWIPIMVGTWYGEGERAVEVVSETALWYSTVFLPVVPLCWVLIRDPKEEFETQALLCTALLCTDLDAKLERIISWFVRRWLMEATFAEVRQRLRFETQRHWSERAIQRTAPALLGVFSVITLLAHQYMAKKGEGVESTKPFGEVAGKSVKGHGGFGFRKIGIAIGGMDPGATNVERDAEMFGRRPGAAADAVHRL
jgi:hypothetical protein